MTEKSDDKSSSNDTKASPLLTQRIDALLADAAASGALALQAARQAAALAAAAHPDRFRKALKLQARLDPFDPSPRIALARRLAEEGDLDEARREAALVYAEAVDQAARAHAAFILGEIARARHDFADARKRYEAVAAIEDKVLAADPGDPVAARWHARAIGRLAELDVAAADLPKARLRAQGALAMLRALGEQIGENPVLAADIADAEMRMGALDLDAENAPAAGEHLSEAIGRYEILAAREADEPHWRAVLADCWALAAEAAFTRDAPTATRHAIDKALQLRVKLAVQDPRERWSLAATWRLRAAVLAALTDAQGAAESLNQARALGELLCAEHAGDPLAARFLVHTLLEQADHALAGEAYEIARAAAADARRWAELFAQAPDAEPVWRADLATAWDRLGHIARATHKFSQAQDAFARAVALRRMVRKADPQATSGLAAALLRAGECALDAGDIKAARAAFAESVSLRLAAAEADPGAHGPVRALAVALERIGLAAEADGDPAGARTAWEEELALAERIFSDEYDHEGQRFRAVIEAHLANVGGENAETHRAAAIRRFDTLAREGQLAPRDEAVRARLWRG